MDATSEQGKRQTPADAVDLIGVLHTVIDRMHEASGAAIVTLYLYDADAQRYYAPLARGIPDADLKGSIPDMQDQLARYLGDVAQGKAPADLQPKEYGPNVWLTVTRRPLLASDARAEIGSTFIRRHHIRAIVGLPLVAADTLVGLLYLDYAEPPAGAKSAPFPEGERLVELERLAQDAALAIDRARKAEERNAFVVTSHLASHLSASAIASAGGAEGVRAHLGDALDHLLGATNLDAALIYQAAARPGQLDLVAQRGLVDAPAVLLADEPAQRPDGDADRLMGNAEIRRAAEAAGLYVVASIPLEVAEHDSPEAVRGPRGDLGSLVILSRDEFAYLRRTPATRLLVRSAAQLIAGALASQRLINSLEDANRVFGALGRMSGAMLRPGATRQEVIDAVVRHLIDAAVPEFDFQFANIFLLGEPPAGEDGSLVVQMAAGAALGDRIDAAPAGAGADAAPAVPRWVQIPNRAVAPDDVLAYAARHWQIVVIGAAPSREHARDAEELVTGYGPEQLAWREIPVVMPGGKVSATVPAALIGGARARPSAGPELEEPPARPFTLDGAIFSRSGHRDLVRIFVPFGLNTTTRATGVLEAGYHRSHKRHVERTQVEALRAATAQIAVAVETARMYEDARRHAQQLEIIAEVSQAMASTIDLDETLRIVTRSLARSVGASLCQIALYEEDGSAWYGAAASDDELLWRRQRGEHPERSFLFDLLDRRAPLVIADAQADEAVNPYYARLFGVRSLLALPLAARGHTIGAAILIQRDSVRHFTPEEVQRASGLASQAAVAIENARLYASAEEDPHIQRDVIQVGFGEWGQKAYEHLLTLKQFFNFKIHVVERETPGRRQALESKAAQVAAHGDALYWDSPEAPAREQLRKELESACYVITYIATPAPTHLPVLSQYYDLSNVIVIEKPLGASAEAYREFLDSVEAGVQIVAADHYYFKLEVRLLHLLLTEERTLKSFLDDVEEIEMELVEERPLTGAAADIGIIEDMMPHAFAIISLFTPIDRIQFAAERPLAIARQEPLQGQRETYARLRASFPHRGRTVRLVIDVGKGVETAKWIKLSGEKRLGGRPAFYKFDFARGQAVDGTQTNLRAAIREIRQPGVPDNAHLTMLRHVIERRYPAVGILAIREAMRSNQRIQELEAMATELLSEDVWTPYHQGQRPRFEDGTAPHPLSSGRRDREPGREASATARVG